ncbi:MAG: TPM domain-containing protein [Geobacteraceae bacterium]
MKKLKARTFFSEDEGDRIRQAVERAESDTSGEIATMVVDHSDSYREAEILGALSFAGLLGLILALAIHHITIWSYIPLVILFFIPARYLFRQYPDLKLPFVGRSRVMEAVRERAVRAFFEKGLYKTRDEAGILIFISILERKVWILGDKGINAKIAPQFWSSLANEVSAGLKQNRASEALCTAIEKCGNILKEHFPRKTDDVNELEDDLIV